MRRVFIARYVFCVSVAILLVMCPSIVDSKPKTNHVMSDLDRAEQEMSQMDADMAEKDSFWAMGPDMNLPFETMAPLGEDEMNPVGDMMHQRDELQGMVKSMVTKPRDVFTVANNEEITEDTDRVPLITMKPTEMVTTENPDLETTTLSDFEKAQQDMADMDSEVTSESGTTTNERKTLATVTEQTRPSTTIQTSTKLKNGANSL